MLSITFILYHYHIIRKLPEWLIRVAVSGFQGRRKTSRAIRWLESDTRAVFLFYHTADRHPRSCDISFVHFCIFFIKTPIREVHTPAVRNDVVLSYTRRHGDVTPSIPYRNVILTKWKMSIHKSSSKRCKHFVKNNVLWYNDSRW
jgi:hypothetical protein